MDATTIDSRIAALVAGDGLIETRLAELDSKLSAWLEVMKAGQAALLAGLQMAPGDARAVERLTAERPPTEGIEPVAEPVLDDEQLLATLDAETANAIRVKRRLCRGKRPVRELLKEMQAARPPQAQVADTRKRWWRRSDG